MPVKTKVSADIRIDGFGSAGHVALRRGGCNAACPISRKLTQHFRRLTRRLARDTDHRHQAFSEVKLDGRVRRSICQGEATHPGTSLLSHTKWQILFRDFRSRPSGNIRKSKGGAVTANGIIRIVFPGSGLGNKVGWPDEHTIDVVGRGFLDILSRRHNKKRTLANAYSEFPSFATALTAAGYGQ
jgi:hypothetical protein